MYRYRYINKHYQFEHVNYTLVLEDLEGDTDYPIVRIEKSFAIDPALIDNDFLYEQAKKDIIRVLQEQADGVFCVLKELPVEPEEVSEEGDE